MGTMSSPARDEQMPGLIEHMRTRVERSRKTGRKRTPPSEQIVGRTAMQLLRRILRVTDGGANHWQESNAAVAKCLHVDPATIKRTVRSFCEVGLLSPIETKGGRGRASIYSVDEQIAREVLASGRWPTNLPNRRTEQAQDEGQKAGQPEKPGHRTPPYRDGEAPAEAAPCGARDELGSNGDAASGGWPTLDSIDLLRLAHLTGAGGTIPDPLSLTPIRQWWEAQPEGVRRAAAATSVEVLLVAAAAILGGWRAAAVAALLGCPIAIAYALSRDKDETAVPAERPTSRPFVNECTTTADIYPLLQALADVASHHRQ